MTPYVDSAGTGPDDLVAVYWYCLQPAAFLLDQGQAHRAQRNQQDGTFRLFFAILPLIP
jgi:hypothetical protein